MKKRQDKVLNKLLGKKQCKGCERWLDKKELTNLFGQNWCDDCIKRIIRHGQKIHAKKRKKTKD